MSVFSGSQHVSSSGVARKLALNQDIASARAIRQLTLSPSLNERHTSAESAATAVVSAVDGGGSSSEPAAATSSGGPRAVRSMLLSASMLSRVLPVPSLPEDRVTTGSFTARQRANRACSSSALRMPSISHTAGMTSREAGSDLAAVAGAPPSPSAASSSHKEMEACLLQIFRLFAQLYGPIVLLLDNLHDWDSWSCQLLTRVADSVMLVATTKQPSCRGADDMRQAQRRASGACTANLLNLGSTLHLKLGPF